VSRCLWRSLSVSRSCSWVGAEWSGRLTGGLGQVIPVCYDEDRAKPKGEAVSLTVGLRSRSHLLCIVTKRMRLHIQAAEMRVSGLSFGIGWGAQGRFISLQHQKSQLRRFELLVRMPWLLPRGVFQKCPAMRRPQGRPRTCWRDDISRLSWQRLVVPPDGLQEEAGAKEVWESLLRLTVTPATPLWVRRKWMDEWKMITAHYTAFCSY